jgi:hypothetical protein
MVSKIKFGAPCLREVRLVRKYELEGVAFVEGYEKAVSFTFHSGHSGNLSLRIEDVCQAKEVYDFFRELLGKAGMNKSIGWLFVEWNVSGKNREAILLNIEKSMSTEWKNAFRTILSVYDK